MLFFQLCRTEKSTDQVIKPVNIEALAKWVGQIPDDVIQEMHSIAPMLLTLGYDPHANPPNYGKPDPEVADNTLHIRNNHDFWRQREKDIFDKLPTLDSESKSDGGIGRDSANMGKDFPDSLERKYGNEVNDRHHMLKEAVVADNGDAADEKMEMNRYSNQSFRQR